MPMKHAPATTTPAPRRGRTSPRPRTRMLLLSGIILYIVTPSLIAETVGDFSRALANRGVTSDQTSAIVGALDEDAWDSILSETDVEALALSVAYAVEEGLATREETDIGAVTRSAAAEITRLRELGFSRQEAARGGVRHTRSAVADLSDDGRSAAAEQAPRGPRELPPAAREAARRGFNRGRPNAADIRSRIPGAPARNPAPTPFSPGTDSPDTDDPDDPDDPDRPGPPTGPE